MKPPHSEHPESPFSPEMIAAGVRVLRESGVLFAESSADLLVVRRILEAAQQVAQYEQQSSPMKQRIK